MALRRASQRPFRNSPWQESGRSGKLQNWSCRTPGSWSLLTRPSQMRLLPVCQHIRTWVGLRQQLNWLKSSLFGVKKLNELTVESLTELADDMLAEERMPQTVAGYLTILVHTLDWASRRKFTVPISALKTAMEIMWEDEVLARSDKRERRPSLQELNLILDTITNNPRQIIPIAKIIVFTIFSCRRLEEICRLRWEDLRIEEKKIVVRDMKHPRKKEGNDAWCLLTDEILAVILSMPKTSELIFPFKATSKGAAWRRHRDRLNIKDLRFHDLRHEGISRLFEMEYPAAFVAKYSGHMSGSCLYRSADGVVHGKIDSARGRDRERACRSFCTSRRQHRRSGRQSRLMHSAWRARRAHLTSGS